MRTLILLVLAIGAIAQAQRNVKKKKAADNFTIVVAQDGSGKYSTIQEAIDRSEFSSVIKIKAGVYRENIVVKSFIQVEGEGADKTIVIGNSQYPTVQIYNVSSAKISKVTFRNEDSLNHPVLISKFSNFVLESCYFQNGAIGAAILFNSAPVIRDCRFELNNVCGILFAGRSLGTLTSSAIINNGGEGIRIEDHSAPSIERNTIASNKGDGVVWRDASFGKSVGNYIFKNAGFGIVITERSAPLIRNNTVIKNGSEAGGGGAKMSGALGISFGNNIIAKNRDGIVVENSKRISLAYNNVWANVNDYINADSHSTDVSIDPKFVNEMKNDYRIDSLSPLNLAGEDHLSIGAHFDFQKSDKKQRLDYLKTQATKEMARENWGQAHQNAQEILAIDKLDMEGKNIFKRSAEHLSAHFVENARAEFLIENYKAADNFINMALTYDAENTNALEIKQKIDEELALTHRYFILVLVASAGFAVAGIFWFRRRVRLNEIKRQAQWWLDDAVEHIELAMAAEADKFAQKDFAEANKLLRDAKLYFNELRFEACELKSNESVRTSDRARDTADRYKRNKREALAETSSAEIELERFAESPIYKNYEADYVDWKNYLSRAQEAIKQKQYLLAKELAEQIQSKLQLAVAAAEEKTQRDILDGFAEVERIILEALTLLNSQDLISAVIEFKSELILLKNGFSSGIVSSLEAHEQMCQIKSFVEESLRIHESGGGNGRPEGRKRSHFEILGIKEDASLEQIKAVYRKLSMIYHPDANASDDMGIDGDDRFKEIKAAYESLILERS